MRHDVLSTCPKCNLEEETPNDVFHKFVAVISDTIEKHAPLTCLSRKQARLAKKNMDNKWHFYF